MRKGKAADAHDARVVGLECVRAKKLMLMMPGCVLIHSLGMFKFSFC